MFSQDLTKGTMGIVTALSVAKGVSNVLESRVLDQQDGLSSPLIGRATTLCAHVSSPDYIIMHWVSFFAIAKTQNGMLKYFLRGAITNDFGRNVCFYDVHDFYDQIEPYL